MAIVQARLLERRSSDGLKLAAAGWLAAMLLGQWAFFYYIAAFYGGSAISGDFEVWNRLAVFGRHPFVAGDGIGNLSFLAHALAAGIVALGGALQLVPQIRSRFPTFHRWNGWLFLLTVTALSLSGFYLVWIRSSDPINLDRIGVTLNGVLILAFAAATWRAIKRRDIAMHREWALRLYLVSNGQWFMRVGMFCYMIFVKVSGVAPIPMELFFRLWGFGCFLVPLALLQLYFVAKRSPRRSVRLAAAVTLIASTLLMAFGTLTFGVFSQKLITGAPLM
jgi:uncharacterized membrane protein